MKEAGGSTEYVSNKNVELELKILLVGAPKSGKTSLVRRLLDKIFREDYVPTLGFDLSVIAHYGSYQGRPVKLHLWDVAGSQLNADPCHHALIANEADGALYVVDVTNRESLQAVDDWDRALSKYLPPRTCKLLLGHKADLPAYVVNDEALSLYVKRASGFRGWCLTVGSSEYGDYDVAARRGRATADGGGRYKGQSLSGEKQLSVSEAMRTLLGHVFRTGTAGGRGARPAAVVGQAAAAGAASPLLCPSLDEVFDIVDQLGLAAVNRRSALDGKRHGTAFDQATNDDNERGSSMMELLRKGRGPDSDWRRYIRGGNGESDKAVPVGGAGDVGDGGWRYFAGCAGREEAETLLRERPEGTFFLRRKGPSSLVLSYVAKSLGTPGSGRRSTGSPPPRSRSSSSMVFSPSAAGARWTRGSPIGGAGWRLPLVEGGEEDLGGSTSVQHALLVYEGGFFSDEKGRLGRFPTLDELLKSKISALARYPLSFRRQRGRYILIEPPPRGTPATDSGEANPEGTLPAAPMSSTHGTSNNPSAERDGSSGATQCFAPAEDGIPGEGVGMNPAWSSPGSASPRASAGAFRDNHSPRGGDRRLLRGSNNRHDSYSSRGGNWIDGRSKSNQIGVLGPAGGGASGSGSLWMEAAAAAAAATATREQPSAASGAWGAGVRSKRLGSGASGSENEALSAAVATDGLVDGVGKSLPLSSPEGGSFRRTLASQRGWKQPPNTSLAVDDVSSPHLAAEASAVREMYSRAHAELYGGRTSNQPSAMARAAEEVAAVTTAKGHPLARRVEEHMHAVQSGADRALATLEVWLKPLVKRRQSPASSAGGQGSIRGSSSAYRSPHDPRPPLAWSETGERGTRWIASVSTMVDAAAPLARAAALLMERANARRLELVDLAQALRERAICLAVAEASAVGEGGDSPDPGASFSRNFLGGGGSLFSPSSDERYVGGAAHRSKATAVGFDGASRQSTVQEVAEGLPGLSSCRDFERILGEETRGRDCAASFVMTKAHNDGAQQQAAAARSLLSVGSDLGRSVSDSSVVAEPSSTLFGADHFAVGGRRFGSTARGVRQGKYSPTRKEIDAKSSPDSWREVFRDVAFAEEHWKELVVDWCSAGLAFREACEDDFGEADGGMTQDFLFE